MWRISLSAAPFIRPALAAALAAVLVGGSWAWLWWRRRRRPPALDGEQGRRPAAMGGSPPAKPAGEPAGTAAAPAGRAPADLDRLGELVAERQRREIEPVLGQLAEIREQLDQLRQLLAGGGGRSLPLRAALAAPPAFAAALPAGWPPHDPFGDDPPGEHAASPAPSPAELSGAIEAFCAGRLADRELIDEARRLALRWGSALAAGAQRTVQVTFDTAENRVLVFQRGSHSEEFFLVLRSDAHWSFDLELIFDAHGPGGGTAERSPRTAVKTLRPSLGRLAGPELAVTSVGEVEVRPL